MAGRREGSRRGDRGADGAGRAPGGPQAAGAAAAGRRRAASGGAAAASHLDRTTGRRWRTRPSRARRGIRLAGAAAHRQPKERQPRPRRNGRSPAPGRAAARGAIRAEDASAATAARSRSGDPTRCAGTDCAADSPVAGSAAAERRLDWVRAPL